MAGVRRLGLGAFVVILVCAGFVNALQARANGELAQHLGNGVQAAVYSYGSGLLIVTIALLSSRSMRAGVRRIPAALREGRLAWWALPAGMLGGLFIACQAFAVPLVGVAVFSVGMVAGQAANSLVVDRVGLSPIGRTRITPLRLLSAVIAVAAVVIAVWGRWGGTDLSIPGTVVAFLAGCVVAVQQAVNGRVNIATQQPMSTTWVNFVFGTSVLVIVAGAGVIAFGADVHAPTPGPWFMWLGGLLGMTFLVTASWAVPRYGVLLFALIAIAGQLTAALVLDVMAPVGQHGVQWTLVVGVVMTFLAVGLTALRHR